MENTNTLTKKRTSAKKANVALSSSNGNVADLQETIRLKAYELYVQRGYTSGADVDDWLTAEKMIHEQSSASKA